MELYVLWFGKHYLLFGVSLFSVSEVIDPEKDYTAVLGRSINS
jgi:hypothetical protein